MKKNGNVVIGYDNMVDFMKFRIKFFNGLDEKTNWGKEQVKTLFNDVYIELQEQKEIISEE